MVCGLVVWAPPYRPHPKLSQISQIQRFVVDEQEEQLGYGDWGLGIARIGKSDVMEGEFENIDRLGN
jgi:hypothetical protein